MNKTIEYKGYKGSIEYSEMDGLFYGKVQGIFSLISYEGKASKSLFRIFMVQWWADDKKHPTTDPKIRPQRREIPKNFDYPRILEMLYIRYDI